MPSPLELIDSGAHKKCPPMRPRTSALPPPTHTHNNSNNQKIRASEAIIAISQQVVVYIKAMVPASYTPKLEDSARR